MSWRLLLRCFFGHQFGDFHQFYPCFFHMGLFNWSTTGIETGFMMTWSLLFRTQITSVFDREIFSMNDGRMDWNRYSWNRFALKKNSRCATLHPLTYRSLQSSIPSCYWTKYGHRCMHIYTCTCIGIDNWKIDWRYVYNMLIYVDTHNFSIHLYMCTNCRHTIPLCIDIYTFLCIQIACCLPRERERETNTYPHKYISRCIRRHIYIIFGP